MDSHLGQSGSLVQCIDLSNGETRLNIGYRRVFGVRLITGDIVFLWMRSHLDYGFIQYATAIVDIEITIKRRKK